MEVNLLNKDVIHVSWRPIVDQALETMNSEYLASLTTEADWLPGPAHIFNAFTLPLTDTRYILFGESPYPRADSANGYAFWDGAVEDIWSPTGLSKTVNRATSLRNLIKTMLVADNALSESDTGQVAIATADKSTYVSRLDELFSNLMDNGVLLLNTTLVLSSRSVRQEAKFWDPFIDSLLTQVAMTNPKIELILFGNVAKQIQKHACANQFTQVVTEHPYNVSFIANPIAQQLFQQIPAIKRTI